MMLFASIMCSVSAILLSARVLSLIAQARAGSLHQQQLEEADQVHSLLMLISFVVTALTAIAFCLWLHRVQLKVRDELRLSTRFGAWYSVAAFFIPIANFRVPPMAVAEAWRLSSPHGTPGKRYVLAAWWGLWLGWMLIGPFAVWYKLRGDYDRGLRLGIMSEAVLIGAGIAAMFIVRAVTRLWAGEPAPANG